MAVERDKERQRVFTRRALMLGGLQALGVGALAGRMYYLQVIKGTDKIIHVKARILPPVRGRILDRDGKILAGNRLNYRLMIAREYLGKTTVGEVLDHIAKLIDFDEYDRERFLETAKQRDYYIPVMIKENLTWEQVAKIEVSSVDLPGVFIEAGETRDYELNEAYAHVLGHVGLPTPDDVENDPLLKKLPDLPIGKQGLEKVYDLKLRGIAEFNLVQVNALGKVVRTLETKPGEPGTDIRLNLDAHLQRFATERLGDESGAAVLMDVHTGGVLAMASTPGFDPNLFTKGISNAEWKRLSTDPKAPLNNKAIAGQYSPGSTFKMLVALAALEHGLVKPDEAFTCTGVFEYGKAKFHCWKRGGHGKVDLHAGIQKSCDVYFYELALRLGIDRLAAFCRRFGLDSGTGIDMPYELSGLIPDKAWKKREWKRRKYPKEPWRGGETVIAGIGQGYVLTTPLQLAMMMARLVNGGRTVVPHIARPEFLQYPELVQNTHNLGYQRQHLDLIRAATDAVVNDKHGTAYKARIEEKGMEMGGKTGTVQVRRITEEERKNGIIKSEDRIWKYRDHALFVGYAPIHDPRYAISVVVEHGNSGSGTAAPIARDILLETQKWQRLLGDGGFSAEFPYLGAHRI